MNAVETLDPAFRELIDPSERLEKLATGFQFTEGPIWHPREAHLLFSDLFMDTRRKYQPGHDVVVMAHPCNKGNGMTYDKNLDLIICEHVTARLIRRHSDGTQEILASHFEGKELNSPNDVCMRSDGTFYFSDPNFGRVPDFGVERPCELDFQGVYRVTPRGELHLAVDRKAYEQPNGLCFSPDESLLYINDSPNALIDVYDVAADGSLSNRRRFADNIGDGSMEVGIPDGMKCDERGNIWVTGPKGIWIFDSSGERLGTLLIPEHVGNLHWGGPDWKTLFIAASTSLYAIRTLVGPRREPFMP